MKTVRKLLDLLTPAERKRALLLLGMILVMALLDLVGVASIMPFMAVLADPQLVETNAILAAMYDTLGFTDPKRFLFFLGVVVFVLLVVSLAFKALTTYAQLRFTLMREYSVGKRLVEGYLHQPYTWFLDRHSADLGKTILSEVGQVVSQSMLPMMVVITQSAIVVALLALLVIVDPILAFSIGVALCTTYGSIFKLLSAFLSRIGAERVEMNHSRFAAVSEVFGSIKQVKVHGLETAYLRRFSTAAKIYAQHQASAQAAAQIPRFLLESVAFGGMLVLVLILMLRGGSLATALPVIALYAFAGYRLMPALQQVYANLSLIRFGRSALNSLHADLMSLKPIDQVSKTIDLRTFGQAIELKNVSFRYPSAGRTALKGFDATIHARTTVGLVGASGSGKTTAVDIILGLLEPQEGVLEVDGHAIDASNRRQWQKMVGYVPQDIYLTNDSVAANIAFGLRSEEIDQANVERAAKIASLSEFIIDELPQGYATPLGERGVRLSGGQRQRIGIARALYHNPKVLVLDEATSSLDTLTEKAVMDAVNSLRHEITIIVIAHRLSTVMQCDSILLLEDGRIKARGAYDQLRKTNAEFRAMTLH